MNNSFPEPRIKDFQTRLNSHPIYTALKDRDDLRVFMNHHVYSVWDFMSLSKFLQRELAPSSFPWTPRGHPSARRFINEIVIEEESDEALPDANGNATYASHFELYCSAMEEIGADASLVKSFVNASVQNGIRTALDTKSIPVAAKRFVATTFDFIDTGAPHIVAAAFALGREHIIPTMFRSFLKDIKVTEKQAPIFHFYLNRHIHLDEDFHAPSSLLLLNEFCQSSPHLVDEAVTAAEKAVDARITFWDGVLDQIQDR